MKDINIFEFAAKNKLRFSYKGSISAEDLYDLKVEQLDTIYKTLRNEEKKLDEESLLSTKTNEDIALSVKIEIVKHIVSDKLEQAEIKKKSIENAFKRKRLLEIKAKREDAAMESLSDDELNKMLEELSI